MSFGAGAWTITDWQFVARVASFSVCAAGATEDRSTARTSVGVQCVGGLSRRLAAAIGKAQKGEPITAIISEPIAKGAPSA